MNVNDEAEIALRSVLPAGPMDSEHPLPAQVHALLATHGFAGIVRIDAAEGDAPPQDRVRMTRIDGDPALCVPHHEVPDTREFEIVTPPPPPSAPEAVAAASRPSMN